MAAIFQNGEMAAISSQPQCVNSKQFATWGCALDYMSPKKNGGNYYRSHEPYDDALQLIHKSMQVRVPQIYIWISHWHRRQRHWIGGYISYLLWLFHSHQDQTVQQSILCHVMLCYDMISAWVSCLFHKVYPNFSSKWASDITQVSTAFFWPIVRGIHQWLVDSPHKGPVKWCQYLCKNWCKIDAWYNMQI